MASTSLSLEALRSFIERQRATHDDVVDHATAVAENLLAHYLGEDWVYRYVRGPEGAYFRSTSKEQNSGYQHYDRLFSLGELLFNFQDLAGVEALIDRLRVGEVEPVIAELEAAYFVSLCGLPFRFRRPQSKVREDYDIEVDLPNDVLVACEGKCKLESTPLTAATVHQTLEAARKQLPKNGGVVIVKLPGNQMADAQKRREVGAAVAKLFRRSGRVSGIVAWWEIWRHHEDGSASKHVKFRNDPNPAARSVVPMEYFEPRPRSTEWTDLMKLMGMPGGYRAA